MKILNILIIISVGWASSCSMEFTGPNGSVEQVEPIHAISINDSGKKFGELCFRGTHNSYSGGDRGSISSQLNAGMRFFELDLWPLNSNIAFSTNWEEENREMAAFEYAGNSYIVNYRPDDGQISIDRFTGNGIENVYRSNWAQNDRQLTALEYGGKAYLINYRADNGQVSIDRFTGNGLINVYQSNWASKERAFATLTHGGNAYLVNYRHDNGQISINMFTGTGLTTIFQGNWEAKARVLTTLHHDGQAYLVNYRADNGKVSIDKFTGNGLTHVYTTSWAAHPRELSTLSIDGDSYLVNYRKDIGQFSINGFKEASLYFVYKKNWVPRGRVLTSFNYGNKSHLVNYRADNGQVSVDRFNYEFVLGHHYPDGEVSKGTVGMDFANPNPLTNHLIDWLGLIKDKNPMDYPVFLMLELKEYEVWLNNGLWQAMLDQVENTLGPENVVYIGSSARPNGVDRRTALEDLIGKYVVYLEPNSDINFDHSEAAKALRKYRQNRKYQSLDWRDYYNDLDGLDNRLEDAYNEDKIIRLFRMEEYTFNLQLAMQTNGISNIGWLNYAISDDPNDVVYQYVTTSKLSTVPE
ncbi:hypothetical protein [Echinicola sediminis]